MITRVEEKGSIPGQAEQSAQTNPFFVKGSQETASLPTDPLDILSLPGILPNTSLSALTLEVVKEVRLLRQEHQRLLAENDQLAQEKVELQARLKSEEAKHKEATDEMYSATHDLRGYLTTIQGNAQLLARNLTTYPEDKSKQMVATIDAKCKELNAGITDALSGLDSFQKPEILPAEKVLHEIMDRNNDLAQAHGAEIEVALPNQAINLCIHPRQVQRTVTTLLLNSIQEDAKKIEIWPEVAGEELIVYVFDNGRGMSPEVQARCFEPGFSAKKATKQNSGQGLNIERARIERFGGKLALVESQENVGTVFALHLPLVSASS